MKRIAAFMLIVSCSVILHGQEQTSVPKQAPKWSLSLKTGGAPWEKKFEVELDQSGSLVVLEQNPDKLPENPTSKLTVKLTVTEAQQIYEQALKAFREFRFGEEPPERPDGTNLTLQLIANRKVLVMQLFHIGQTEDESVELATVFSLINKHLPAGHRIY